MVRDLSPASNVGLTAKRRIHLLPMLEGPPPWLIHSQPIRSLAIVQHRSDYADAKRGRSNAG